MSPPDLHGGLNREGISRRFKLLARSPRRGLVADRPRTTRSPASVPQARSSSSSTPEKVANNAKVNGVVFQFLAIVAGIVCGCLGLTDLKGFAAFGLANVAIGGAVVAKCGFKPSKYFIGIDKVVVDGASLGFGTFVLFWTLFYNICHLF
mgnify:CR=1 FL=1